MSQCLRAAEMMFNRPMPPPAILSPLKRKSVDDPPDHDAKRQAVFSPREPSPRGHPFSPGLLPAPGAQPVNIQPRPNGYGPAPATSATSAPSVSAAPYNPTPTGRRRGRPPKSVQNTWQVSTYPAIHLAPIAPAPVRMTTPQPLSPGLRAPLAHPAALQAPPDPKPKRKALPDIAPRPAAKPPSLGPAIKSPAAPDAEYQSRREYYRPENVDAAAREQPPVSTHCPAPVLPPPQSPLPRQRPSPPRDPAHPALAAPTDRRETPPADSSQTVKSGSHASTSASGSGGSGGSGG